MYSFIKDTAIKKKKRKKGKNKIQMTFDVENNFDLTDYLDLLSIMNC